MPALRGPEHRRRVGQNIGVEADECLPQRRRDRFAGDAVSDVPGQHAEVSDGFPQIGPGGLQVEFHGPAAGRWRRSSLGVFVDVGLAIVAADVLSGVLADPFGKLPVLKFLVLFFSDLIEAFADLLPASDSSMA